MSDRAFITVTMLALGVMIGALLILFAFSQREQRGIYIPCDLAEISPDIPPAAKEQCRRRAR